MNSSVVTGHEFITIVGQSYWSANVLPHTQDLSVASACAPCV